VRPSASEKSRATALRNWTRQRIGLANMVGGLTQDLGDHPSDIGCTDAEFLHLRMVDYALGEGLCPGCARRFRGHRWRETFK
jgi:hypothetical protein